MLNVQNRLTGNYMNDIQTDKNGNPIIIPDIDLTGKVNLDKLKKGGY